MDGRTYTAWELAGDWTWANNGYVAMTANGRTRYELATASKTQRTVCLSKLTGFDAHLTLRYVHPDTPMKLVKP